jgi:hypothetical protein
MHNNVLSFFLFLCYLVDHWPRDVEVSHDWGSNIVTIQGNGVLTTIVVIKRLNNQTKRPKAPLCYDFQNRITNVEKDFFLLQR